MRRSTRFLGILSSAILVALAVDTARAEFHLMQIQKLIGGVNGDTTAQAVQLRMRGPFENQLQLASLYVHDAAGKNRLQVIDFQNPVANAGLGDTILIASPNFANATNPPAQPDFVMTNLIPASYMAAGSLTFEDDFGTVMWRVSWGGSNYTGSNLGAIVNDPDGNFGPPFPGPLPTAGTEALEFQGGPGDPSNNNAADYAVSGPNAVFTNNAGEDFIVEGSSPCAGAVCGDAGCDGMFNGGDIDPFFLALGDPIAWQAAHPGCEILCVADINMDGSVNGGDIDPFFRALGRGGCL
ncbi:MAG: hypothetical protein IH986_04535 [Planctomycetes bacterium]|nr:hypothetical protein [Planctomycetota bacterium]